MDTHPDNPPETSDAGTPPSESAAAEAPAAEEGSAAPGIPPRGPRRRRRRRRGPPRQAPAEAPRLGSAVEAGERAPTGEGAEAGGESAEGTARPVLKLRTLPRRRRRLPHAPGLRSGAADAPAAGQPIDAPAEGAPAEGTPASEGTAAPQSDRPPGPPRRRRRRRRGPRPDAAAASGEAVAGDAAATPGADRPPRRDLPGRTRRPRREGEGEAGGRSTEPGRGERERREAASRSAAGGERRDERDRGNNRGDGRGRRGGPGDRRGRGGPERKVERKLYSVDAVVDRGFEDVEAEGETKRVHWTIVKRTVADQISRKPVSVSYVLQRDGNDTEFPSLGAARDSVNKTIVHPEKLTPSKSEIAALKGSSR